MGGVWVGIDAGKTHHWAVVLDTDGKVLLSRRVANDEPAILELVAAVSARAEQVRWAVDQPGGGAALLLGLLWARDQQVVYVPGRAVNRAADSYRGEGKTDAKDARVIADQARMRRDFAVLRPQQALVVEVRLLVARRRDLVTDRTRVITRLREYLTALCPALERTFDLTQQGPLRLLTGYQTPTALRRAGVAQVAQWLAARGIRNAEAIANAATQAAAAQKARLPGERLTAQLVAELAEEALRLTEQIKHTDTALQTRVKRHPHAKVLLSLPGMGMLLAAEFLAATGGELAGFASADHLAAYAGLAPVPRDSGRRVGNLQRPRRYNRSLLRVFYLSALSSLRSADGLSRAFYDRKRAEGKGHIQALLALARRRVNVLWALLRDGRVFQPDAPKRAAA
jgi:transposase